MKKILSIALVLCMMLSMCVVSVGAAGGDTMVFEVSDVEVVPGDTFTIDVSLTSNPGFAYLNMFVKYDATVMTLTDATTSTGMSAGVNVGKGVLSLDDQKDYAETGVIYTLTFKTVESATGDYTVSIAVNENDAPLNWDWEDVPYDDTNAVGKVSFKPAEPEAPFTATNIKLGEKFAINVKYNATANDEITVTYNGKPVDYTVKDGVITIANIDAKGVDKEFIVTVNGFELPVSVAGYCDYQIEESEDPDLIALAESVLAYNAAANNYFENAGESVEVAHCDVGTDNPRVVANSTTGGPTFYSVRLQLNDGVMVVVRMEDYNGEDITVTIDGVASDYTVEDVEGMKAVFVPVKATQYDADIVIATGDSTLTYSVNTYIQQKQTSGNADLVNLVNALGWYGKATQAYAA